ncbi:LysR family transcriptional regulator [Biomaibacter acetigenes]|uniref:LysR family transcriptional regulator n=1 Tax=Biomaibacter acetigenes TaxID=2316383 RepID=A0A3G2R9A0_9FIRM|nr:selenium metabolism-associated LysR family transcriptional regulator [Biomaibacter acetigenes]AYO32016.1 LysR family transcriptional regulator [Biomaibacter acetigenes]RKL63805.1 LysR family transcriptional regulator [Thermoanaerobacteraceae bacterium SP2]
MNLNMLKAFITAAEAGCLSKAAEKLFISQPALTQQIKQLENHFSVQLIERSNRGVSLTEAGVILNDYAARIVALYEELESKIDGLRASVSGNLVVGATSVVGGYAVPCSIFIFKEKYPEANIKLKVGNRSQVISDLKENAIDVAVIEGEKPRGAFKIDEIATDEMVVITPNKKPWQGRTSIRLDEFLRQPLIMREKGSGTWQVIEKCLSAAGIDKDMLNIVMELSNVDSIKASVEAGHGISIMSRLALKKELHNRSLLALKLEKVNILQKIYLAYKHEKVQTKVAKAFINFMHMPSRGFC